MNFIDHAEMFLGSISRGWKEKDSPDGVQVVLFRDSPSESINTFLTIGLSSHDLSISDVKSVRQELLLSLSGVKSDENAVSLLLFVCDLILNSHKALLRGQVIRLPFEAAEKIGCKALYCAIPVFMDDGFATFNESRPPTVVVWIVPIYESEANYIDTFGWDAFEELLEKRNPDVFSLGRDKIC